ncbi:hypothetical protein Acor_54900 [Acrocarpospora corrugata]|uniref:Restriction endonuclease type IV Mrr domain-containing protein n=1 Tax=Acrocarpospora corrugata TaxID=35763 RepID=A0A5M3W3S3_9ACTN|nr:restriction endonuclease [Acrocarpospora corrugata]GES03424.1 hypothetical protein Acor_54900 [Acrocarpospora corrugata]
MGSRELQTFGGTFQIVHGAHLGVVVTTSTFTKAALAYAAQADIRTYDKTALAAWASATGPAPWNWPLTP